MVVDDLICTTTFDPFWLTHYSSCSSELIISEKRVKDSGLLLLFAHCTENGGGPSFGGRASLRGSESFGVLLE